MLQPKEYQFDLPQGPRPALFDLQEKWYPGIEDYWPAASNARIYGAPNGIRAVVIHATAGSSSSGAVSVIKGGSASFHWLVPDENEAQHGQHVWACVPEYRAAWHVRNSCKHPDVWGNRMKVNHFSLGIEVVNAQVQADSFSQWQLEMTAQIVRYCWAKYPNLRHVVSHAKLDPTRRTDPGKNFDWNKFKELVLNGNADPRTVPLPGVVNARDLEAIRRDPCL